METKMECRHVAKKLRFLLFLFYFCISLARLPLGFALTADGITLLELKKSLKGEGISDWSQNHSDPCSWTGVTCSPVSGRVIALNISGTGYCSGAEGLPSFCPSEHNYSDSKPSPKLTGNISAFVGNLTELRVLSLPCNALDGKIPAEVSKLSFLEVLELQGNSLSGSVPLGFSELSSLRVLNLGYNFLSGEIPPGIVKCLKLVTLILTGNMLNGTIPGGLGRLPELRTLSLSYNQLSGAIPAELAAGCRSLEHLHLSGNLLVEGIPWQLGNCYRLRSVLLFSNILEGKIPKQLGRLRNLESLDVSRNTLIGEIPEELGNCTKLSVLVLTNLMDFTPPANIDIDDVYSPSVKGEFNYFDGGIPVGITTHPRIRIIWAPRAGLSNPLPASWGNCDKLQVLNLGENLMTGRIPDGLGKCKSLVFLDLSSNRFHGDIPDQLPVRCMVLFNISRNSLSGAIPTFMKSSCSRQEQQPFLTNRLISGSLDVPQTGEDMADLYANLFYYGTWANGPLAKVRSGLLQVFHDLSQNNFTGPVPPALIGKRLTEEQPSYGLFLNDNKLAGNISSDLFVSCQSLESFFLNLSANQISGEITAHGLLNCSTLKHLEAAFNQIRGPIASMLGNLESLVFLDLSTNNLHGDLPPQLGQLKKLQVLLLAHNKLTGLIPVELGQLSSLVALDLSSNAFIGKIPGDLVKLSRLECLLLDANGLSGQIPKSFAKLTALKVMNVSFNNLSGPIPESGNSGACDSLRGNKFLQPCSSASLLASSAPTHAPLPMASSIPHGTPGNGRHDISPIAIASVASACAIALVVSFLFLLSCFGRRYLATSSGSQSGRKEVVTFTNIGVQLTYENVVRATGNFNVGNLIGNGGFGSTYKAELIPPGLLLAVKRLSVGRFQGIQQFDAEISTLGSIRHQNLVTLIGYYASETEMFLIYNYLPGGNLESFIHERSNRNVHWRVVHKIALDIAQALSYLHDCCVPRVLHRDIKPSNILLDNNLNAYLSDFGLARLLEVSETHATTDVHGTFGYVAPEYAATCRVSDKADVYSYGVVFLELLSGKKSLDPSFSSYGNGFNIVSWACMLVREGRGHEFFIPGLWDTGPHEDLVESLHLAIMCTIELLSARPSMKLVVKRLKQLRPPPLS